MDEEKKKKKNFFKRFLEEFKEFALKGNVMSMAVGVIIGAAFQNIVTALTNSFINPLIALITGGVEKDPETGANIYIGGSFTVNGVEFSYGAFLSAVINFIIMALILFLLIKGMNSLMSAGEKHKKKKKKGEPEPAPEPEPEPEPDPQLVLLAEIRDLLKKEAAEADEEITE